MLIFISVFSASISPRSLVLLPFLLHRFSTYIELEKPFAHELGETTKSAEYRQK